LPGFPLAWLDWKLSAEQRALLDFTRELLHLRKRSPSSAAAIFSKAGPSTARTTRPLLDQARRLRDDRL
jgi:pullulanase/glycogen debranching enzyme